MLESKTRAIGGAKFKVTCLPGTKGRKMLVHLLKLGGPTIAKALKALQGSNVDSMEQFLESTIGVGSLADALMEFSTRITEDEFEYIVQSFAEYSEVCTDVANDAWLPMDKQLELYFAGKHLLVLKWLAFALEVNYSDFLGGADKLKVLAEALSAKKTPQKASASRNGSIGMSTESQAPSATAQA